MKTIINNHNKNIPGKKLPTNTSTCNGRNKEAFLLNGQWQTGKVVYEGTLTSNQPNYKEKKYFEISEESFSGRLFNHNLCFRNEFYKNDAELSKELWQIKMKNYTPKITYNYNHINITVKNVIYV